MNPSLKVARPGWNANTAPDWALVFDSSWPSLQIAFQATVTGPQAHNYTFTHNLGYPPLPMIWLNDTGSYALQGTSFGRGGLAYSVSTTTLVLQPVVISTQTVTVVCYNIDISKDVIYPLPASAAAAQAPDLTTGIKIARSGRNINSPNMNDFILNSQCQSPAILQVATDAGQYYTTTGGTFGQNAIIVPLQTPYIPWITAAYKSAPGVYGFANINSSLPTANGKNILFNLFGAVGGSLIIMRDPLVYPNQIKVVY